MLAACSASVWLQRPGAATPSPDVRAPKGSVTDHVGSKAPTRCCTASSACRTRATLRVITLDDGEAEVRQIGADLEVRRFGQGLAHHGDPDPQAPSLRRQPRRFVVGLQPDPGEPGQGRPDWPCRQRAPAAHATRPGHRPERPAQPGAVVARGCGLRQLKARSTSGSCPSRHDPFCWRCAASAPRSIWFGVNLVRQRCRREN